MLDLKKITFKSINDYRLLKKENDKYVHILQLQEIPQSYENYFVEVKSDEFKSALVPVVKVEDMGDKYNVVMDIDDLVEHRGGKYEKTHDFLISKRTANYTSFDKLLQDIRLNPSGTFTLSNDISASEVKIDDSKVAYLDDIEFTGKLYGQNGESSFAILDLVKPLFNTIKNATIQNLDLKDANVTNRNAAGALAITSIDSTISNVAVSGSVYGNGNVGGIVSSARGGKIEDVVFKGKVKSLTSLNTSNSYGTNVGGIAGELVGGKINKAYVDGDIQIHATSNHGRAGGIAGKAADNYARISNVFVLGTVTNRGTSSQTGGIVGSLWWSGRVDNGVAGATVIGGNKVYGDSGDNRDKRTGNIYTIDGLASGSEYNFSDGNISMDEAKAKLDSYGITATLDDTTKYKDEYKFRATYKTDDIVYKNVEKFIPFYNKEQIEKYAAKVADNSNVKVKKILSITPMKDNKIITSINTPDDINRVMVNYDSGMVEYFNILYTGNFNKYVPEYNVEDLGIIYTPDIFVDTYNSQIDQLVNEFSTIEYNSDILAKKLGVYSDTDTFANEDAKTAAIKQKMKELYLEDTFNELKTQLPATLRNLLAGDKMINVSENAISSYEIDRIVENKEYIMMAITYLQKWYPINFKDVNIKDLVTFNQEFNGSNVEAVDWLIKLGKAGYNELLANTNPYTYKMVMSEVGERGSLFDYFKVMNEKLSNYSTMNEWFKASTKAYIGEANLGENNEHIVKVYDKMIENRVYNSMVLPLLSAQEGIYIVATANGIHFGMFDRYMDMNTKESNPDAYQTRLKELKAEVDKATERQRNFYNFWYNIVDDNHKTKLIRDLTSWDGYNVRGSWLNKDNPNQAMKDFFLPIQRWYGPNNSGAYANGILVHFVNDSLLNPWGTGTFSHEMVHNNDGGVFFNGNGRRNDIGAEYFAYGMLHVPHNFDDTRFGINSMFDFSDRKDHPDRVINASPERINTREKLADYMRKTFDLVYTMDYAEAELVLDKGQSVYTKWFNKITTYNAHNSGNVRVALDPNAVLTSVNDLIDNDIIADGLYGKGDIDNFNFLKTNGYYLSYMFAPIFSGGENPDGAAGDLMFRRMSFEMLAYKGWDDGFIPYVSNKLKSEAIAAGLPKVTDPFVINKISNGEFQDMKSFKKEMFRQRYEKRNQLKAVTINHNGQDITIDSYDKLKEVLGAELDRTLARGENSLWKLKRKIFSAYLRSTDDFVQDVYK